ncbi:PREDICTED: probable methyltransferase PMT23 [Ipomoea nil]|uniref:probable methyltransferase PMT23 n=1 Tax=Ipomoea nil TaxID=35883 RepID=UPI000900B515|nr:PREDICTED: probable methyltransferase PMT23 [Ipomoea nil]
MATSTPSLRDLFKERKFPFILSLFLLLFVLTFLLISNSQKSPLDLAADIAKPQLHVPNPVSTLSPPPPPAAGSGGGGAESDSIRWKVCDDRDPAAVDFIPCLDNWKAISALKSRRHMEHRERHCPDPPPRCLVPLPAGYRAPVAWPKSRDMIWYNNVPHPRLVEYKKDQRWVVKSGDYFVFPGGGTQFKEGVSHYVESIEKALPVIEWGKHTRVVLDVGCGVATFGGFLLDKNVVTMSFAPKDEHEAQIQFALERGIPATLSVIGTQKLAFPDNVYDLIHCARCRVHWDADGGRPLMELNRILRPGGFFIWSATPVYRDDERDRKVWEAMVSLTKSICWKVVKKTYDKATSIGMVIYQKPISPSCYKKRKENNPPLCDQTIRPNSSWYARLDSCLSQLPVSSNGNSYEWPEPWPERLSSRPPSLSLVGNGDDEEAFNRDTKHWASLLSDVYLGGLEINWSGIRNVMDMNAGYGGFAAALIDQPVWVMNVIPISEPDTLPVIFDRGLIGVYHDWCESFNTYPRTYDLLQASLLFEKLAQRCDIIDMAVEVDRILRPGGVLLVHDTMDMLNKLTPILRSLHWSVTVKQQQFLVGKKGFWRPDEKTKL